jgi:NAD(P)-dependent dehydrogenase (short-subunit alcohol dehydrogenase family)
MTYQIWVIMIEIVASAVGLGLAILLAARRLRATSVLVVLWLTGAIAASRLGFFRFDPLGGGMPVFASGDLIGFALLGTLMTLPVVLGIIAWRRSQLLRARLLALPAWTIVGVQIYRIAGIVFLGLASLGLLPWSMGLVTGSADTLVAIGALGLAIVLKREGEKVSPQTSRAVRFWAVFGIADFAVAVSFVTISILGISVGSPEPVMIGEHPLAVISLFQVPLSILLHLLAIRKLAASAVHQTDRTALVVGATKGIGRAVALRLADLGYRVYGTGRSVGGADTSSVPNGQGVAAQPRITWLTLDVTSESAISEAVSAIPGGPDIVINSAGFDLYGSVLETSIDEFSEQIDVNLTGAARLVRAVVPGMIARGGGLIIQLSSLGGLVALPNNSAYSASKYGVEGFFESLRTELADSGILVSLIEPGQVNTESLSSSIRWAGRRGGPGERTAARSVQEGNRVKLTADGVAKTIIRVVEDPQPSLRYTVGTQAKLIGGMKRWFGFGMLEGTLRGRAKAQI